MFSIWFKGDCGLAEKYKVQNNIIFMNKCFQILGVGTQKRGGWVIWQSYS